MKKNQKTFGEELRTWRQRRHLSQLELATEVDVSTRHLSFMETGRSQASRAMVLRLAAQLDVPLRERNEMLVAAGYAPMYALRPYADPSLSAVRDAVELILKGHEPFPALLVDRHWTLVSANQSAQNFLSGVDESLLQQPINVLRVSLHPNGLASRIENLAEWRAHVIARLARDVELTADPKLSELLAEIRGYGGDAPGKKNGAANGNGSEHASVVVPLKIRTAEGALLSFFTTTTVFGTAVEVTLSELVLEALYPADEFTASALRGAASASDRAS